MILLGVTVLRMILLGVNVVRMILLGVTVAMRGDGVDIRCQQSDILGSRQRLLDAGRSSLASIHSCPGFGPHPDQSWHDRSCQLPWFGTAPDQTCNHKS
eukprot:358790-Chlamydomonas_euryale.AAC.2